MQIIACLLITFGIFKMGICAFFVAALISMILYELLLSLVRTTTFFSSQKLLASNFVPVMKL